MPRPPPGPLRQRASAAAAAAAAVAAVASSSSSAASSCTCRAPARPSILHAASYTTVASTFSTPPLPPPAAALPPATKHPSSPLLDFLVPGWGYFSRALPPRVPSSGPSTLPSSSPPCPSSPSSSRAGDGPPSMVVAAAGSATPPPPPAPQPHPFDVRSWRPQRSPPTTTPAGRGSRTAGPAPLLRRSVVPLLPTPPASCGCGRVRHSCLRCRAQSTAAMRAPMRPRTEEEPTAAPAAASPDLGQTGPPDPSPPSAAERDSQAGTDPAESARSPSSPLAPREEGARPGSSSLQHESGSATATPSARLRRLLDQHAPASLPHVRGTGLLRARPSPRASTPAGRSSSRRSSAASSTTSHASLPLAHAEAAVDTLVAAAANPDVDTDDFYHALSAREQLDLVRALSRIVRAVAPSPAHADPLSPAPTSLAARRAADYDAKRTALRHRASHEMLALLRRSRHGLAEFAKLGTSVFSSLRQSAALLVLDAVILGPGALDAVGLALRGGPDDGSHSEKDGLNGRGGPEVRVLAEAFRTLFRPPLFGTEEIGTGRDRTKDLAMRVENQRTALAQLLQLWHNSTTTTSRGIAAEQACRLVTTYADPSLDGLFTACVPGRGDASASASLRAQLGLNDVLRRSYGALLATLEPSPAAWLAAQSDSSPPQPQLSSDSTRTRLDPRRVRPHLVTFLAESGHAVAALEVYRLPGGANEESAADDDDTEEAAVRMLTSLVRGLTRERLFEDAAPLAAALDTHAQALQARADKAVTHAPLEVGIDPQVAGWLGRVAEAYRVLARLATDQGRTATLEDLLGRLARLGLGTQQQPSPSPTSLEPVARRMAVHSVRHELDAVRSAFATAELARARQADRARVWGQLVVAHVRVNDLEGAIAALQDLLAAGLHPPLPAVNSVLYGFARRGRLQPVLDLFAQLEAGELAPLRPDATSWNALVLAHATARDPTAAEATVEGMKRAGVSPTRQTWTTLMNAYVENGQWSAVSTVYRFLDAHPDPTLRPDTPVLNVMLKACLLTGTRGPAVLDLFRELVARGVRPDMVTYLLVLHALCASGMMAAAEDLYRHLDRSGPAPHLDPDLSRRPFASRGTIRPDGFVLSALMAGYARLGQGVKARACLAEMRARGIEPSSVTMAVLIEARLGRYHEQQQHDLSGPRLTVALERAVAQARAFLDQEGSAASEPAPNATAATATTAAAAGVSPLARRRAKRQPVRADRPLATGTEAIAVFGPILRVLARTGDASEALQLLEEILDRSGEAIPALAEEQEEGERDGHHPPRRRSEMPPIALYTGLMSAFWQRDQPMGQLQAEAAARNVHLVWSRLYDALAARFVRPDSTATPEGQERERRPRVDPAQASALALPFTILVHAARRAGLHMLVEPTWRRLAREGFALDASNWNALALYFVHDMQLERALWITEHVLCEPVSALLHGPIRRRPRSRRGDGGEGDGEAATERPDLQDFERELGGLRRADAVGRTAARQWAGRIAAHELRRNRSYDHTLEHLQALTTGPVEPSVSSTTTTATATDAEEDPAAHERPAPEGLSDKMSRTLSRSHAKQAATLWHPYGRTLSELQAALDLLTAKGTLRIERKYERRLARQDMPPPYVAAGAAAATERGEVSLLSPDEAAAAREDLQRRHPKTMRALELWRTRRERVAAERKDHQERVFR